MNPPPYVMDTAPITPGQRATAIHHLLIVLSAAVVLLLGYGVGHYAGYSRGHDDGFSEGIRSMLGWSGDGILWPHKTK
jgi:hypothetical protein